MSDKAYPSENSESMYKDAAPSFVIGQDEITAADSDLSVWPRAVYVGSGGTVVVQNTRGVNITYLNVPDGFVIPCMCKQVRSTGTTASGFVGWYG